LFAAANTSGAREGSKSVILATSSMRRSCDSRIPVGRLGLDMKMM